MGLFRTIWNQLNTNLRIFRPFWDHFEQFRSSSFLCWHFKIFLDHFGSSGVPLQDCQLPCITRDFCHILPFLFIIVPPAFLTYLQTNNHTKSRHFRVVVIIFDNFRPFGIVRINCNQWGILESNGYKVPNVPKYPEWSLLMHIGLDWCLILAQ